MATVIQIKRSGVAGSPAELAQGELAYSYLADNGSNGGDRLYIGPGTETDDVAADIEVIGGIYFTSKYPSTFGAVEASKLLSTDSNSAINTLNIGNSTTVGGTLKLNEGTNNGSHFIAIKAPNAVTADTTLTLPDGVGSNGQVLTTDGSTGALSWSTISSTIQLAADRGSPDTFTTGNTLTFTGGTGIDTTVSDDTITIAVDATIATASSTTTFTNKTFDANGTGNSITNIEVADFASGVIDTDISSVSASDDTLASAKAIKAYVDSQVTAIDVDIAADTGTIAITDAETLTFTGGTGIDTSATGNAVTFAIDSSVTTNTGTQTLTNKTIDASSNTLSNIGNSSLTNSTISISDDSSSSTNIPLGGGFSILGGTGITSSVNGSELTLEVDNTITTNSGTQTLTNKTIDLGNNTLTGTTAEFNTALQDGSFATLDGTETLTNKTINSASNTITITESNISDLGSYITATSTDTLSNKTINGSQLVDGTVANAKLINSSITVTDGTTSTATSLGGTITFSGTANEIEVGESSGTLTFGLPDDVTIGNNLTISGNLTVSGTTTTVNTEIINLADNTITLNSNETGTPSQDGGIEIERGTSANKTLIWNETTDKWTVGSETFVAGTFEGALTGNVTGNVTGDVTGNADTATTLETARNIAGQSFDGSADITIASTDLSDTSSITLNSATQTLTNKTINSASNTITITESNISDLGSYITASSTDTLTNKSGNISQ